MGSDETTLQAPTPPTPPSATGGLEEYLQNLPQLLSAEKEYGPQFAEVQKSIQDQLYPGVSALTPQLAERASTGITEAVPAWMRDQFRSDVNAQLGANVSSRIGADFVSRGLMQQQMDYNRYYENLAMSLSGRQPLTQGAPLTSGYTPQSIMGLNASNFGTGANIYGTQAGLYGQQQQRAWATPFMYMQGAGNVLQGLGSFSGGGGYGPGAGSVATSPSAGGG